MNAYQQINAAIIAHKKWKERFSRAIENGSSEFQPNIVRADNQCDFGKWLYQQTSLELQQSPHYQSIKHLHAKFHQEAASVLEMALQGRKHDAEIQLGFRGEFARTASALKSELVVWYIELLQTHSSEKSVSSDRVKAILEERAKLLAKSAEVQTGESIPLVVFTLANETYGIATEYVREVQPLREVTPVPCTPDFVVGVINIRGSIYSVIDIRSFFHVAESERPDTAKVILVSAGGLEVGIWADDVRGATSVPTSAIKSSLAGQGSAKDEYIRGITQDMLIILNLETLLQDERITVREEVS